jgi:hypothetical protein
MPLTEAAGLFVGHARPTVGSGRDPSVGLAMPPAKTVGWVFWVGSVGFQFGFQPNVAIRIYGVAGER